MTVIVTRSENPDAAAIDTAVTALRNGKIIAYLTDTLYALGGDAQSSRAIEKILSLKGRSVEKALPVIIGEKAMLDLWVDEVPLVAQVLIEQFWPGPLTLIFKASAIVPLILIGNTGKIAIRLPNARLARDISKQLGAPIIATSANRSGEPVASSAEEIAKIFGTEIAVILDSGPPSSKQPSTLLDVTVQPPLLVRAGAVPAMEITKQIGETRA
jgi:L-threonylcarbamoyladenylate synthase